MVSIVPSTLHHLPQEHPKQQATKKINQDELF